MVYRKITLVIKSKIYKCRTCINLLEMFQKIFDCNFIYVVFSFRPGLFRSEAEHIGRAIEHVKQLAERQTSLELSYCLTGLPPDYTESELVDVVTGSGYPEMFGQIPNFKRKYGNVHMVVQIWNDNFKSGVVVKDGSIEQQVAILFNNGFMTRKKNQISDLWWWCRTVYLNHILSIDFTPFAN